MQHWPGFAYFVLSRKNKCRFKRLTYNFRSHVHYLPLVCTGIFITCFYCFFNVYNICVYALVCLDDLTKKYYTSFKIHKQEHCLISKIYIIIRRRPRCILKHRYMTNTWISIACYGVRL